MEIRIAQMMIEYLLAHGYRSKRALATEFGIPYRTLLKVCGSNADMQSSTRITKQLVRGCIEQCIPIENAIHIS